MSFIPRPGSPGPSLLFAGSSILSPIPSLLFAGSSILSPGPSLLSSGPSLSQKWVIVKGSGLRVNGSTNINRFSCEIADYCSPDTIILNEGVSARGDRGVALTGRISLDVSGFDCHNTMMTAELRKTVKAVLFPRLTIRFLSLSKTPDPKIQQDSLKGQVDIELAGVTKHMEINYTVSSPDHKLIRLTGDQQMKFSDFGLIAPRKLGGMIRTSDRLDIEFHLNMKAMD